MSIEYRIGDVFERMAEIPDGSIDLIVTSPPFLALRSYLPDDHPDKAKEIGSEPTPAEFIDTLLALTAEWGRVLAPHGSLCVELGDTYSGKVGWTTDDPKWGNRDGFRTGGATGDGWPLAKSMTGIPHLYHLSLAYGRNILTGEPSPAGQWRIRNVICWARPNPPVGALGDKFRPATSYITVACKGAKRYFDLDAVRTEQAASTTARIASGAPSSIGKSPLDNTQARATTTQTANPAGAPPLDWHADDHPEDGDWLWKLSTQPYKGSHYATFPMTLPKRLIEAMCPLKVCNECGVPSTRIVSSEKFVLQGAHWNTHKKDPTKGRLVPASEAMNTTGRRQSDDDHKTGETKGGVDQQGFITQTTTLGWSDCGHDNWRTGNVLDPFAGSGTTLEAAQAVGRRAIGIDLDERNADLARERVGMFLTLDGAA